MNSAVRKIIEKIKDDEIYHNIDNEMIKKILFEHIDSQSSYEVLLVIAVISLICGTAMIIGITVLYDDIYVLKAKCSNYESHIKEINKNIQKIISQSKISDDDIKFENIEKN
jgi:hypothetical protein